MDYISPKEISLKWGVSERLIQKLCEGGRINGAIRFSKVWAIPKNAKKPVDGRLSECRNQKRSVKPVKRMLIVEDDESLSRGIAFAFEKVGFSVINVTTLADGQRNFEQHDIDIVILDLNLPDGDGVTLCQKIREVSDIPVIMLTARDLETDEVEGLMAGADDYVTKPFSLSVLRARVEAVLRRMETKNMFVHSGKFRLDINLCKLYCGDDKIPISATEFRLLKYLMTNVGHILSKEQILAALWDNEGNFVDENALQVNISRLRAKIEETPKNPQIIKTVHGMGYVWVKE